MNYKQMFYTIVATNGLHSPERRRGPSNIKKLLVLILISVVIGMIGSTFFFILSRVLM